MSEREKLIDDLDDAMDDPSFSMSPSIRSLLTRCRAELKATPPREPTRKMLAAGAELSRDARYQLAYVWRAMYDAAKDLP
jgi:hypothetical protein